jgi:proline dehydrogenase
VLDFNNTEIAFAHKSNSDLKQASLLFSTIGNSTLTGIGVKLTTIAFKIGLPINGLIKSTLYQHFVGGENLAEASTAAEKIYKHGVSVILDYGVEGKESESEFNYAAQKFIEAIQFAVGKPHIPFVSIKVTGFARFQLLAKLDRGESLNESETQEWKRVEERFFNICEAANAGNVMILVDAEETWIQDPVDELAYQGMKKYNQGKLVIYNTYQMYRHDRLAFLKTHVERSIQDKFTLGVKLVRGAYMEKERLRAVELNYPSPIQPNKVACDKDFDLAVSYTLLHLATCALFIGTHNDMSCMKACEQMQELGIQPSDHRVYFSQLYGMSDHISFNLARHGYLVSKYLPYGPVKDVTPYLMRRAQENTSVAGQTSRELSLIKTELKRRKI